MVTVTTMGQSSLIAISLGSIGITLAGQSPLLRGADVLAFIDMDSMQNAASG